MHQPIGEIGWMYSLAAPCLGSLTLTECVGKPCNYALSVSLPAIQELALTRPDCSLEEPASKQVKQGIALRSGHVRQYSKDVSGRVGNSSRS
jgi:hypothetical protein